MSSNGNVQFSCVSYVDGQRVGSLSQISFIAQDSKRVTTTTAAAATTITTTTTTTTTTTILRCVIPVVLGQ